MKKYIDQREKIWEEAQSKVNTEADADADPSSDMTDGTAAMSLTIPLQPTTHALLAVIDSPLARRARTTPDAVSTRSAGSDACVARVAASSSNASAHCILHGDAGSGTGCGKRHRDAGSGTLRASRALRCPWVACHAFKLRCAPLCESYDRGGRLIELAAVRH